MKPVEVEFLMTGNLTEGMRKASGEADQLASSIGKAGKVIGGMVAADGLKEFATKMIDVRSEFQSLQTSFRTLLGDAKKGDRLFEQIKEFAVATPLMMGDLAKGAQTMLSFNLPLGQIMENLHAIGDISRGDAEKFNSLVLAFSQMSATGKLMGQDLLQMINAGFNPLSQISEKTGKSIGELKEKMADGAIGADMVRQAFIDAASSGGKFSGMLEDQSKILNGEISNLKGAIDDAYNDIGTKTEGIISGAIGLTTDLVKNYETIGRVVTELVAVYGAYKAALIVNIALERAQALNRLAAVKGISTMELVTGKLTAKLKALNATMLANPYALVAAAVVAMGVGMYEYTKHLQEVDAKQKAVNKSIAEAKEQANKQNAAIKKYLSIAKDAKAKTEDRQKAINKLKDIYPAYFKSLNIETAKNYDVAKSLKAVALEHYKVLRMKELQAKADLEQAAANKKKAVEVRDTWNRINRAPTISGGTGNAVSELAATKAIGEYNDAAKAYNAAMRARVEAAKQYYSAGKTTPKSQYTFGDGNKTGKTKGNKEANERKRAAEKLSEDLKKLEQDNQEAQTALMEEGREKRLQVIEDEYNKRIAEISKQQKEFEENNKKAGKSALLTSEQRNAIDKATKLAQQQRKKQIREINREEITAMRDYLRQYGTFQEQTLAIDKEYAEKISKAQTEGEKRTLEKERDKALDEVTNRQTQEAEGMKSKIDWAGVFNDLGVRSTKVLQNIKKQLQDILRTNHNLAIDDIKDISEKISQIDSELGNRNNWFYSPTLERYKEAKAESARAGEAFQSARRDSVNANADVNRNKQAIAELLRSMGIKADARAIDSHDLGKYIKDLDPKKAEELNKAFDKLAKSEAKAEKAGEKEAKMGQEAAKAKEKEANAHLDFSQKMAAASEALNSFENKLADLPELLNQLGLGKASEKVGYGLKAIKDTSGAMADIANHNYIGAAAKTISAVKNVGRVFGIGEGNGKEVAEKTERLTKSNERLTKAVDGLKDEMSKQGGAKSIKTADEALKDQKQINAQTMEILKTQMGYSHSHHSNAHYFNLGARGYASVNETLAQYAKNNPLAESVVSSVSSLADIYKLTPEQMDYIRKHNVEMWESMLAQGKYDKSEYWEAYADLAGATDEITNALKASITQTTYDSFRDGFKSSLLDMDKDATSFADGFSEKLMQSVLNARISDVLDDDLQKFYNDWFEAGKSDAMLTASEIASLRERYDELVERGLKLRDEAAKITGYDATATAQNGKSGGFSALSQDQGVKLEGLFTSQMRHTANIDTNVASMSGLMNMAESHLATIAENSNYLKKLDSISNDIYELKRDGIKVR